MYFLLGLYLSSVNASLICNVYYNIKCHHKAKKESKRSLKFKNGLNYRTKIFLSALKYEHFFDLLDDIKMSFVPVMNAIDTINTIIFQNEKYEFTKETYDLYINDANKTEENVRRTNVEFLKSIREKLTELPEDFIQRKDEEDYMIGDKEVKKILKLNKLNYDVEMLKFEQENDIKY